MKSKLINQVEVLEVTKGDIFQYVKASGCYERGNLLVVQGVDPSGDAVFVSRPDSSGAYGSLCFLSQQLSSGVLRYAGTIAQPDILSLEY